MSNQRWYLDSSPIVLCAPFLHYLRVRVRVRDRVGVRVRLRVRVKVED